jgi:hypothetical protein
MHEPGTMTRTVAAYITAILAFLVLWGATASRAEVGQLTENQVKAAYLFNFAKFVEWPGSAFVGPGAPLVIGIIGKGPYGEAHEALSGRTAKGRRVVIRQLTRADEAAGCQILFIAASEKPRLQEILRALPASGVLTVSDLKNFCRTGGMIGLITRGEKLQFEINVANAERAGLKLSSQMLKLAVSVLD